MPLFSTNFRFWDIYQNKIYNLLVKWRKNCLFQNNIKGFPTLKCKCNFLEHDKIKQIVNYLKILHDFNHNFCFYRAIE